LKWIIENGTRFSGMPAWKGILTDEEMWYIVRYIRHLPAKGSLGAPKIFEESAHELRLRKGPRTAPLDIIIESHAEDWVTRSRFF
jgi:hypothetical protein